MLALAAPACSATERPEGIVERWLISLNQGAAGDPERYAPDRISNLVVPGWAELEPGELDLIEVGRGGPRSLNLSEAERYVVPFLIERLDGRRRRGTAILAPEGGWHVEAIALGTFGLPLPSEGGPGLDGETGVAWIGAIGLAALLILATAGLMRLAPEPRAQTGSSR
jgi:hypothetical protein